MNTNPDHSLLKDFFSESTLAAELDVTIRTLRRWRRERTGPSVTHIGRKRMYRIDAVERWLASREQPMVRSSRRIRSAAHATA
jgi:hypothetical protein